MIPLILAENYFLVHGVYGLKSKCNILPVSTYTIVEHYKPVDNSEYVLFFYLILADLTFKNMGVIMKLQI